MRITTFLNRRARVTLIAIIVFYVSITALVYGVDYLATFIPDDEPTGLIFCMGLGAGMSVPFTIFALFTFKDE